MDIEITRLREEHDELVRDRDEFEKDGGAVDQLDGEASVLCLLSKLICGRCLVVLTPRTGLMDTGYSSR